MKKSAKLLIAMVLVVLLVFTLLACGETDIQQSGNNVDYTISFETNGGSAVADIVVDGKTEITIPETSKEGYSFAGWFLDDKTFSIKVDLSYIKANPEKTSIKLYAKWIEDKVVEKTYKIVFSTNGGSDIADIVVDGKSEITMLNTTKSGYTFAGWYVDNNTFNIPFCLNYITANPNLKVIKIYAKWTTNRYTVTFDSNGGSVVAPITQEYNTLVVKPKNPTKTENNFVAWYKDSNLTVAFNFATDLLTKDTILYAKWTDQNLDQFFDFAYVDSANTSYSIKKKANTNLPNEIVLPSSFNGKPVTAIEYGAFSGCSGLTSVTIPNSVTSIGDWAFSDCSGLTGVTIPDSVTSIGGWAFYGCNELSSIAIPDSVTSIGSYMFDGCSRLSSITIPDSVTSIGMGAFYGCNELSSIAISNSVTSIGDKAFYGTAWLNNQPDGLIYAGKVAYQYKGAMPQYTAIILLDGTFGITDYAFDGCSELTSISIPNSVTSIGMGAFNGCSGINSISIPNSVTSIGSYAFQYCSGLTSVTIGSSVTSIGGSAFNGCSGLTGVTVDDGNTNYASNQGILMNKAKTAIISVPQSIKGDIVLPNTLMSIGSGAFSGCSGLTSVTIGSGVTSIGEGAFKDCGGLSSITIPNNVISVGSSAFSGCSGLTAMTLPFVGNTIDSTTNTHFGYIFGASDYSFNASKVPASLKTVEITGGTSIGQLAFYSCYGLTSITVPNSVTSIGSSAFSGCSGLTEVTIGSGVTSIGQYAFSGCSGLTSVTIGSGVTSIGQYAFYGCSGLTSITIPNSVTSIGERAFFGCSGLTSITIPNSVTSIGERAFFGCSGLTSITIPNSVTSIGGSAFYGCSGLTSITIPNSVTNIGYCAFQNCSGLTSITLPFVGGTLGGASNTHFGYIFGASSYSDNANYVPANLKTVEITGGTSIGQYAFSGCSGLTGVTIGSGVTSIGGSAFYSCYGLTSITIPNSVTSIEREAFIYCRGLTLVTIGSGVTSIGSSAFYNCSKLTSITLPFVGNTIDSTTNTHFGYIFGANSYSDNANYVPASLKTVVITGGTSIGEYVFSGCSGLTSVTIGSGVTSIGSSAFSGCSGLTSITLPFVGGTLGGASNTHFGYIFGASSYSDNANYVPASLSTVVITGGTSIGQYAFYGCSGLTSVTIPNSVTSIDSSAFYGCSRLNSITIPNSVTSIGNEAFYGTGWLNNQPDGLIYAGKVAYQYKGAMPQYTAIILLDGTFGITDYAFFNCSGLTSITVPNSVTSIGRAAFYGCSGLTGVTVDDGNTTYASHQGILMNKAKTEIILVPNAIKGDIVLPNTLTSIGWGAFNGCRGLTGVTIPNSVTSIGDSAFQSCYGLTSVTIGSGVTSIGGSAFEGCSGLTRVTVDDGNTTYASHQGILMNKAKTEIILVPKSIKGDIVLPSTLMSIGSGVFSGCSGLTSITIPNSVTNIGYCAFHNCYGLTSMTLPFVGSTLGGASNTHFGYIFGASSYSDNANYVHASLKTVEITGGTSIGQYAFYGCSGLTTATIGSGVTSIGYCAFQNCSGLTSITLPFVGGTLGGATNTHFGYIFGASDYSFNASKVPTSLKTVVITGGTSIGQYAFYKCSGLTGVTIPSSVTSIEQQAFYQCSGLTSITIGSGVTNIGSCAFQNCSGLTSITIPNSVTSIYQHAFSGCSGLTTATIGSGVTSIGEEAFKDCIGLTTITIGSGLTSIGRDAFAGTAWLNNQPDGLVYVCKIAYKYKGVMPQGTAITLRADTTGITSFAFSSCSGLTSITLPFVGGTLGGASNTHFGYIFGASSYSDNANYVPASLSTVVITGGTSIGDSAFYGCSGLTEVTIPNSVTSIGSSAFQNCSGLTSITIPNSVTSIGSSAFQNCSGLTSITLPFVGYSASGTYFGYIFGANSYSSNSNYVPASLKTVVITGRTSISYHAFDGCSGLTGVTIPASVTSIGDGAFRGCSGLNSITLPFVGGTLGGATNTHFGYIFGASSYSDNANYVPASLSTVVITGGTSIGDNAFSGCSGLTSITIPDSVTSIGQYAFSGCSGLTSITIPDSVTSIAEDAFWGCGGLTSIKVDAGNKNYVNYQGILMNKAKTEIIFVPKSIKGDIVLPNTLTSIDSGAFEKCSGLTGVIIGSGVTSIGSSAFSDCIGLTTITIGSGLTSIGSSAFSDCIGLTTITIGSGLTSIGGYAFSGCSGLTSITIPNSVISIGYSAFQNCSGLTGVTIPDSVTSIEDHAFYGCSGLTSIIIPASVTQINGFAFLNCIGLTTINCEAASKPSGWYSSWKDGCNAAVVWGYKAA